MNIYILIIAVVSIGVLMFNMTKGAQRGFARELAGLFSIFASGAVIYVISGLIKDFMHEHLAGAVSAFIMLAILVLFYKLFHMFFLCFDIITDLPVVSWLNKALGFLLGLVEGFFVLCALQYVVERFLLS